MAGPAAWRGEAMDLLEHQPEMVHRPTKPCAERRMDARGGV